MKDRNKSMNLIIVMIGLLLVLSFAIQYANHPPMPKTQEETKESHVAEEHAQLTGLPPMDFTMASVAEGPITISQFKGKKSLVLLFANRKSTTFLKQLEIFSEIETKYGWKGVKPIMVCMLEPIAKVREFAKKNNIQVTMLADMNGSVGMQYIQAAMAGCFIIGKDGKIYSTISNVQPDSLKDELETKLNDMLAGKPDASATPQGPGTPSSVPQ